MIKSLVKKIVQLNVNMVSSVFKFIKLRPVVLYGARRGYFFGDNSKYLYLHSKDSSQNKVIHKWVTKDKRIYEELKRDRHKPLLVGSLVYFFYHLNADMICYTNNVDDVCPSWLPASKRTKLMFLGHGKAIKNSRSQIKESSLSEKWVEDLKKDAGVKYAIATSENMRSRISESQMIPKEKVFITGFPRDDEFYELNKNFSSLSSEKNVLYAPTWRNGLSLTEFFPFKDFDLKRLDSFLEAHEITITLRPHIKEAASLVPRLVELFKGVEKINISDPNVEFDIQFLLAKSDLLITDYSSVYNDFLLVGKPIVFIPYDYKFFEANIGFGMDYFQYIPGPVIKSQDSLMEIIYKLKIEGDIGFDTTQYADYIHKYKDGRSSQRVLSIIESII